MTKPTILDTLTDSERKAVPLASLFDYFPNAMVEIARVIDDGQRQHNTGGKWDRSKSNDHRNSLMRHLLQWGTLDKDGRPHTAKVAVRALMALEIESEARLEAQMRRAATARPGRKRSHSAG